MNIEDRLRKLFSHLGIERAHIASAGFYGPSGRICTQAPDLVASMMLICPLSVPQTIDTDIALPYSICTGDRGALADAVASALQGSDHAHHTLLNDCAPLLWDDLVSECTRELGDAIFSFLDSVDGKLSMSVEHLEQDSGMVAELAYRVIGDGPPLILFPFALAPNQWDPLLGELSARYTVVLVSGAHVPPGVNLESRVGNPGYSKILKTCFEFLEIKPGATILEVGCGTGAVSRVLAEYTKRENPITGMDLNAFLRREATMLNQAMGFADIIEIQEGNAYALPAADNTFDITLSVTVLEEVDADQAIAEMVRVTRPGGSIGAIIRALDMEPIVSATISDSMLGKVRGGLQGGGVAPNGCADASLYHRLAGAGLTDLKIYPCFNTTAQLIPAQSGNAMSRLDVNERNAFDVAVAEAGEGYFIGMPMHVAVGRKAEETDVVH